MYNETHRVQDTDNTTSPARLERPHLRPPLLTEIKTADPHTHFFSFTFSLSRSPSFYLSHAHFLIVTCFTLTHPVQSYTHNNKGCYYSKRDLRLKITAFLQIKIILCNLYLYTILYCLLCNLNNMTTESLFIFSKICT